MIAVVTWAPNISFQTSRGQASAVGQETHAHLECAVCSCWHFCYHNSYSKLRENKYLLYHNQYYLSFWSFVIAVQYLLKWSMPNKIIDLLLKLSVIFVFVISRFDLLHLCNAIDHPCIQKEKKKKFLLALRAIKLAQITPWLCLSNDCTLERSCFLVFTTLSLPKSTLVQINHQTILLWTSTVHWH